MIGLPARGRPSTSLREIAFSEKIEFPGYAINSDHFPAGALARKMTECVQAVFASLNPARAAK
ncbi:hypothetical protein [Achromobacter marplatensis]|uniref:hypothetical protein n=1 Tax=Achromobacter marplatensis TaxID=470868 RepID=UPI0039F6AF2C